MTNNSISVCDLYFVEFKEGSISWESAYESGETSDMTVIGLDNALKMGKAYLGRVWTAELIVENNDGLLVYGRMVHDDNWN